MSPEKYQKLQPGETGGESANRKKWEALGTEILYAARNELLVSMRFLEMAFPVLMPVMDQMTFFLGSDGSYLYYNARFLAERYCLNPVEVHRGYLHILCHGIFRHMFLYRQGGLFGSRKENRLQTAHGRGSTDKSAVCKDISMEPETEEIGQQLWNLACDMTVEYLIDHLEEPCVRKLVSEERLEWYRRLEGQFFVITAERVFGYLEKLGLNAGERDRLSLLFLSDDHRYWYEAQRDADSPGGPENDDGTAARSLENEPGATKDDATAQQHLAQAQEREKGARQEWDKASEKILHGMDAYFSARGSVPEVFSKMLRRSRQKKTDYRSFLRKFASVQEDMQVDVDSFDYGYYAYGLSMYGNLPLIEELEYKERFSIQEFVIALDTSGSCMGEKLRSFVAETFLLLQQSDRFGRDSRIYLLQCDDEVREAVLITSRQEAEDYLENFQARGNGGTDFRPVFAYVEELRKEGKLKHLGGLLYFTDGCGIYPKTCTAYRTAFVFLGEEGAEAKTPPWAMKVVLEEDFRKETKQEAPAL